MESIVKNSARVGRFTSSKISLLMDKGNVNGSGFSAGALTYINRKANERDLNRSLDLGVTGRSAQWGLFLEQYVFNGFVGLEYKILANDTKIFNEYLAGSTDLIVIGSKVSDIKCFEPDKFCRYSKMIVSKNIDNFKANFKSEYWQLVSNAVINNVPNAEAIAFMPYEDELEEIQDLAVNYDGADQYKYRFIAESEKHQLPYVPKGSKFNNLNTFEFTVPEEDKKILLERVEMAGAELEKNRL
jgi:hypothetical protein